MRIIYNNFIPFGTFYAVNICGIIFARKQYGALGRRELNHEQIHTAQQRELLILGFYLIYAVEWVVLFFCYRNARKAYRNISFEREAYNHESNYDYLITRKHYAWMCRDNKR